MNKEEQPTSVMFLVGKIPPETMKNALSFTTQVYNIEDLKKKAAQVDAKNIGRGERFVAEIKKKQGNTWHQWISIGRATNNDVVIKHPSVSKLHARIRSTIEAEGDDKGKIHYWITDADSTSGTVINGVVMTGEEEREITDGDTVALGSVECKFVSNPIKVSAF